MVENPVGHISSSHHMVITVNAIPMLENNLSRNEFLEMMTLMFFQYLRA